MLFKWNFQNSFQRKDWTDLNENVMEKYRKVYRCNIQQKILGSAFQSYIYILFIIFNLFV